MHAIGHKLGQKGSPPSENAPKPPVKAPQEVVPAGVTPQTHPEVAGEEVIPPTPPEKPPVERAEPTLGASGSSVNYRPRPLKFSLLIQWKNSEYLEILAVDTTEKQRVVGRG